MATNKVKRSIHLAQPRPQHTRRSHNRRNLNSPPADLMPVKAHVYHAIAELNAGFEKAIHNMQMLQSNKLFGASGLTAMSQALRGIHARANRELMMALNERETANASTSNSLALRVQS